MKKRKGNWYCRRNRRNPDEIYLQLIRTYHSNEPRQNVDALVNACRTKFALEKDKTPIRRFELYSEAWVELLRPHHARMVINAMIECSS